MPIILKMKISWLFCLINIQLYSEDSAKAKQMNMRAFAVIECEKYDGQILNDHDKFERKKRCSILDLNWQKPILWSQEKREIESGIGVSIIWIWFNGLSLE